MVVWVWVLLCVGTGVGVGVSVGVGGGGTAGVRLRSREGRNGSSVCVSPACKTDSSEERFETVGNVLVRN